MRRIGQRWLVADEERTRPCDHVGQANDRGVPVIELMLAWSMSMACEDGDDEAESYAAGEWPEGMLMAVARERGLIGDRSQRKQRTRRRGR